MEFFRNLPAQYQAFPVALLLLVEFGQCQEPFPVDLALLLGCPEHADEETFGFFQSSRPDV